MPCRVGVRATMRWYSHYRITVTMNTITKIFSESIRFTVTLTMLFLVPGVSFGQIDTTIVLSEIGRNGCPVSVLYRIDAPSFEAPFHWTITATDAAGKLVWSHAATDSSIEPMLKAGGILPHCDTYETCKKEYYFNRIPAEIFQHRVFEKANGIFDRNSDGSVYRVLLDHLMKTAGASREGSIRRVEAVANQLQTEGGWILSIPISPVQNHFPLVYVSSSHQFVPFYEW